jgi:hypothetical protein
MRCMMVQTPEATRPGVFGHAVELTALIPPISVNVYASTPGIPMTTVTTLLKTTHFRGSVWHGVQERFQSWIW